MKIIKKQVASLLHRIIVYATRFSATKDGEKHLLIIKTDEIGDYVLFRNYLKYFKTSEKYKHHKITLLANSAWKQIFEAYDKNTVDQVIWLNKRQYNKDFFYRFSLFKEIRQLKTSDVINCIFSRSFSADDAFAYVATGKNKIAMKGDDTNRSPSDKHYDSRIYSSVIDAGGQPVFDGIRNRDFIKAILQEDINLEARFNVKQSSMSIGQPYYIMFLGAGNPERKWPVEHFLQVAEYIDRKYKLTPVICGGPDDSKDAQEFADRFNKPVINYAGKTTLLQLIELLAEAQLLVSVDTGALHIAAAVQCPVVGLYSGKFYGRFAPYPKEIASRFFPIYPDFVDKLIVNRDPILYDTFKMKNDTIRLIQPEKTYSFIDEIIL